MFSKRLEIGRVESHRSVEDAQSVVRSNRASLDTAILMTLVLVLDYTTLLVFGVQ